jgi:hypothetical protein
MIHILVQPEAPIFLMKSDEDKNSMDPSNDSFQRSSPLYAPGTLLGWYLTLIAILVAWTLHQKRSKSDVLDPDVLIALTLPVVAVGHVIGLLIQSSSHEQTNPTATLDGPLAVTQLFMLFAIPMTLSAVPHKCTKRTFCALAVEGLCIALQYYLHTNPEHYPAFHFDQWRCPSSRSSKKSITINITLASTIT